MIQRDTYNGLPKPHLRFYRGKWRCYIPPSWKAMVPWTWASGITPTQAYKNWVWQQGYIPV